MTDVVDKATRSRMMSGIRGTNTQPEILIRKQLHARGYRYRINVRRLPGKPDIVLPRYRAVIFVNGCFWHGHDCHLFRWPDSRPDFWRTKITRTRQIDAENIARLQADDWRVLQIWECALKGKAKLALEAVIDMTVAWLESQQPCLTIRGLPSSDPT